MDLYTLTDTFLAKDNVERFASAIWTERFFSAGDVQIITAATPQNIETLAEGTLLALKGTKEVMLLESQAIDKKVMTVTGSTLLKFFNERMIWYPNPMYPNFPEDVTQAIQDHAVTAKPGQAIADVVDQMVINPVAFTGSWLPLNLDWAADKIPRLVLGAVDVSGVEKMLSFPIGPLYDGIQKVAEAESVGISLYLDSANPVTGYTLKFTTYQGKDHTKDGAYPLVRLTPSQDSLSNIKEVHSLSDYKNVAYVYYNGEVSIHYADSDLPVPEGLARRVLVVNATGDPSTFTPENGWVSPEDEAAFREQNARDALANHNYIRTVDGQTSPTNEYKYGVDYGLGDIIELESITGAISKARVTEYIRSQDKTGQREYPTISVVI